MYKPSCRSSNIASHTLTFPSLPLYGLPSLLPQQRIPSILYTVFSHFCLFLSIYVPSLYTLPFLCPHKPFHTSSYIQFPTPFTFLYPPCLPLPPIAEGAIFLTHYFHVSVATMRHHLSGVTVAAVRMHHPAFRHTPRYTELNNNCETAINASCQTHNNTA